MDLTSSHLNVLSLLQVFCVLLFQNVNSANNGVLCRHARVPKNVSLKDVAVLHFQHTFIRCPFFLNSTEAHIIQLIFEPV
jgi:hypothetical protein